MGEQDSREVYVSLYYSLADSLRRNNENMACQVQTKFLWEVNVLVLIPKLQSILRRSKHVVKRRFHDVHKEIEVSHGPSGVCPCAYVHLHIHCYDHSYVLIPNVAMCVPCDHVHQIQSVVSPISER